MNYDLMGIRMMHTRYPLIVLLLVVSLAGCRYQSESARQAQVETYLSEAEQYSQQGMIDSALAAFNLALEENPRLVEAHKGIGDIYRQRGDYERAAEAYEQATLADAVDFESHYYLGLMKQLSGNLKDAVKSYLRALAINPRSLEANRDIAAAYLQLGRPGDALPYARRATELDPDSQPAWSNLAATYSLLKEYREAVDTYRQAAELGELADPVLLGLADAHIKLGNYARAINTLNSLIRRNPTSTAYERLGYAQFKMRHFEKALINFQKALSLDGDDVAALNGVGVSMMTLYIEGGRENTSQRDAAIRAWQKSLQLKKDQPRIIDLLSRFSRF